MNLKYKDVMMNDDLDSTTKQEALKYHNRENNPGKISILPTKPLFTQHDLSLAYSPGVAAPCLEIAKILKLSMIIQQKQLRCCYFKWYCSAWAW